MLSPIMAYIDIHIKQTSILLLLCCISVSFSKSQESQNQSGEAKRQELLDSVQVKNESYVQKNMDSKTATRILLSKEWQGTSKSLGDVLEEQTGVSSRKRGGIGAYESISLRGVGGNKIKIFIDGVPLNSIEENAVDLGKISLQRFDRIEIYKGFVSGELGGNAIGGAINLITKGLENNKKALLDLSIGEYQTHNHYASLWGQKKNLSYSTDVNYIGSANDYEYLDRNKTPYNSDDDEYKVLQNAQFQSVSATQKLKWSGNEDVLFTKLNYGRSSGGLPGEEGDIDLSNEYSNLDYDVLTRWNTSRLEELDLYIDNSISGGYNVYKNRGLVNKSTDSYFVNSYTFLKAFAKSVWRYQATDLWYLQLLNQTQWEKITPRSELGYSGPDLWENERKTFLWSLESDLSWKNLEWSGVYSPQVIREDSEYAEDITDSIRYEDDYHYYDSYSASLLFSFSEVFKVFGSVGKFIRLPGVNERFGGMTTLLPNVELKEETSFNAESGLRFQSKGKSIFTELVFFQNKIKDIVIPVAKPPYVKFLNIGNASTKGVELIFQYTPSRFLESHTNITIQDSKQGDLKTPYQSDFVWGQKWNVLLARLRLEYRFNFTKGYFEDEFNSIETEDLWIHDAGAFYNFDTQHSIGIYCQNIFDRTYQHPYAAFPLAGRMFNLNYKINL